MLRSLLAAGLVLLGFAGPALALEPIFEGEAALDLELSETGSITGRSTHDYSSSQWVRTFSLDVQWTRVGVYTLERFDGLDAFAGQGEEYREATGSIEVVLDEGSFDSRLVCTLSYSETRPASAILAQVDGTLIAGVGNGFLDGDAWECDDSQVLSTTHGGVGDVVLTGYALAGVEGFEANAFPAEIALMLGLADSEEEWAQEEQSEHTNDLLRRGYLEAEPRLGEQRIPFARSYAVDEGLSYLACPDIGVDETPATDGACAVDSETKLELSRASSSTKRPVPTGGNTIPTGGAATAPTGSAGAAPAAPETGGSEAPGPAAVALVACLALAAMLVRRRAA